MEILKLPETTSIQASFSVPVANSIYTAEYEDLITGTSYSASATSNANKTVTFTLNNYYMTYCGNLQFNIYRNNGLVYSTGIDVIRPYCDLTKVRNRLEITQADALNFESAARAIIESECGTFHFIRKDKEIIGMGMDYLPVNERIEKLYTMYENGLLIHDSSNTDLNLYKISVDKSSIVLSQTVQNKLEYPKVWRDRYYDVSFASGYDYLINADFGYKVVPEDIQKACEILVQDISQGNMQYLNKYIQSFDNVEFKVDFAKTFFNGTGNFTVDNILSKYKNTIIPGVI